MTGVPVGTGPAIVGPPSVGGWDLDVDRGAGLARLSYAGAAVTTMGTGELAALRDLFAAAAGTPATVVTPATRSDLFNPLLEAVMRYAPPLSWWDAVDVVTEVLDLLCVRNVEAQHISDDGRTGLCGESLESTGPSGVPVCLDCSARQHEDRRGWGSRLLAALAPARANGWPRGAVARQARGVYTAAAGRIPALWEQLAEQTDPGRRASTLGQLSLEVGWCAESHAAGYGQRPIPEEGGRDLAESLAVQAVLLRWLETTEVIAGCCEPAECAEHGGLDRHIADNREPVPWPCTRPYLDRLCTITDPAARAQLVDELRVAVLDRVGPHAAAVLTTAAGAYRQLATRTAAGAVPAELPHSKGPKR